METISSSDDCDGCFALMVDGFEIVGSADEVWAVEKDGVSNEL